LLYLAQCAWFIGTQSLTIDEPAHIVAGWRVWQRGDIKAHHETPPLPRLLLALPLLARDRQMVGWDWKIEKTETLRPGLEAAAWQVRPVNVILGLILAILVWTATRLLFSETAANLALALFAFSPALIAHFSLATVDGASTLSIFALALQLIRWRRNPSPVQTALLGMALGGSLATKFYTFPLYAMTLGLVLVLKPQGFTLRPQSGNWGKLIATIAVSFLLLWATYFFHVTRVTWRDGRLVARFPGHPEPTTVAMKAPVNLTFFVPAAEYLTGVRSLVRLNRKGHPAFFMGEASTTGGWKLYLPVVIVLKWPISVLLLFLATVILALRGKLSFSRDAVLLASFPALFLSLAIFSKLNVGDRYILPIYPFLLVFIAGLWEFAQRCRVVLALVVAGVSFQAADCFRYAPDYLSYFNLFVRPAESWKLLSDSNLDWGQGLIALRKYQAQNPNENIHLAYFGTVDPSLYGIGYVPLGETDRAAGTVVVSATHLSGQLLSNASSYHWVLEFPRKTILNHTLHVFDVSTKRPPTQGQIRRPSSQKPLSRAPI
jgi:hypothetical protein